MKEYSGLFEENLSIFIFSVTNKTSLYFLSDKQNFTVESINNDLAVYPYKKKLVSTPDSHHPPHNYIINHFMQAENHSFHIRFHQEYLSL